jgi:hypothetical protein
MSASGSQGSELVEWNESRRSPENSVYYWSYAQFRRLFFSTFIKALAYQAGLVLCVYTVLLVTRHPESAKMALVLEVFFLGITCIAGIGLHCIYIWSLFIHRRITVSSTGIGYSVMAQKKHYSFKSVAQVLIEPIKNGIHRLVITGAQGELCRVRVPADVSLDGIVRMIPIGKIKTVPPDAVA